MSDIIHLLPDAVANQIAAGEVIQRPASALKELMENAIDAGADTIRVYLKEAGKVLIQIVDNGKGMSESDARMCFERHATSKLRKAEDLFAIRTMGFRGEAMASIAAVAHVEMKTKRAEDVSGTLIEIEGSEIRRHEPCSTNNGTTISIKNLFYNIPARRNFLKSTTVELRHLIEEFQRQALAHPDIFFSLQHENNELFHLPAGNLKQRIVNIFGNNYNERLVPVEEATDIVSIRGYIGKPDFAKKTRGEQYFFVNQRFIKDPYLNHAVMNAYEELLSSDSYPLYVLFIDIDPSHIDINVHPTKTEIKFDDDKVLYAILRATIKRSIGQYQISPTLDFNTESSFGNLKPFNPNTDEIKVPTISVNPEFNPFGNEKKTGGNYSDYKKENTKGWGSLYEIARKDTSDQLPIKGIDALPNDSDLSVSERPTFQIQNRYIVSSIKSGLLIINQQAAHERILFERFSESLERNQGASQQCLFPQNIKLSSDDFQLAMSIIEDLQKIGFDIHEFGKNTLVVYGIPAEIESGNEEQIIMGLLELYKQSLSVDKLDKRTSLARSLARQSSIKNGRVLSKEEMLNLIDELFACKMPQTGIDGKATLRKLNTDDIAGLF